MLQSVQKLEELAIYRSYRNSKYLSVKHASYFQVYEELLSPYRWTPITFVEVGVLNGGSLFMWRDFFGPEARIIGVDLNPEAKRWTSDGFEIHIGNQADPAFWDTFLRHTGKIDILLDDGGHTNEQQIVTMAAAIPFIADGGLAIVEDTHTSYLPAFGNPSPYSFISYAKAVADSLNARFPSVSIEHDDFKSCVFSVSFFESIVVFKVDRSKCFQNVPTSNEGISSDARDYRAEAELPGLTKLARRVFGIPANRRPGIGRMVSSVSAFLKRFNRRARAKNLREKFPRPR